MVLRGIMQVLVQLILVGSIAHGVEVGHWASACSYREECTQLAPISFADRQRRGDFHGQASQDQFVYSVLCGLLGKEEAGHYLEIGGGDPIVINNTHFFDRELGWHGVSIDIQPHLVASWAAARRNKILIEDATRCDYREILNGFPQVVDYLSLDIDNFYHLVLQVIPFDEHVFKVITIEHDAYRLGTFYQDQERAFLSAQGYYLLCPNVHFKGLNFEDWWIYPDEFPIDVLTDLISLDLQGKDHKQIIDAIQTLIRNRSHDTQTT